MAEAGEGIEDLFGGLGPDEGLGVLDPVFDPCAHVGREGLHVFVCAAADLSARKPNHRSTWLIQEEPVGVKCMWKRGCLASHVLIAGVLWVSTPRITSSASCAVCCAGMVGWGMLVTVTRLLHRLGTCGRRRAERAVRTVMVPCSRQGPYRDTPAGPAAASTARGRKPDRSTPRQPRPVVARVRLRPPTAPRESHSCRRSGGPPGARVLPLGLHTAAKPCPVTAGHGAGQVWKLRSC